MSKVYAELPVNDDLKNRYASEKKFVQLRVAKAYDPLFPYKMFYVPEAMQTAKFITLAASEFRIPLLEAVLLNTTGDAITPCQTVADIIGRYGDALSIAHNKPLVTVASEYDMA